MTAVYGSTKGMGAGFAESRRQFESMANWLESRAAAAATHSELEERLESDGRELLRRLLQEHLELRAVRERQAPRLEVTGGDGEGRNHVRESERPLMTVFGPVRVERLRYGGRGFESLFPADATLNLPREEYSHGLRWRAAEHAATVSYEETVRQIAQHTGGKVPARQTQELVRRAAQDFEAFYETRAVHGAQPTEDLLVLSLDGKGIVMRRQHLREGTRRAAEQDTKKLDGRLSKGEKKNRKRMATVAAAYSLAPGVRTAADVMAELRPVQGERGPPRPRACDKRVWASVEKDAETVTRELFDEAQRRDPGQRRRWIVLVDGDRQQIGRVQREARRRGVEVTMVLDLIHVLEYLWKAAWCFFDEGDKAAEQWVRERAIRVLEGRSSDVAAGIRRSATKRGLRRSRRKGADRCAGYLIAKRKMLRYDQYLRDGLPIATGVIEGACRHLIHDRLDITGARWGVVGAEAVLRLRALRSSGDLEEYRRFHLQRELHRNHLSCYAGAALPKAA